MSVVGIMMKVSMNLTSDCNHKIRQLTIVMSDRSTFQFEIPRVEFRNTFSWKG